MNTTTTGDRDGLRRVTGWLLVIGAVTFAVAATILSSTFITRAGKWCDHEAAAYRVVG